jgi:RimJ/RimL family protein N-acetyltransferase
MTLDTLPYPHDLTDGVISLRAHRMTDAPLLAEAVVESVATVGRWQDWCTTRYDEAAADSWIRLCRQSWLLGDGFEMLIVDARTDAILGGMAVNHLNREHRFANLGYWVRESAQGTGIAGHSGRLAAKFAFETVGISRLEIVVAHDNLASRKTAERIGGKFEGILRNRLLLKGRAVDAAMYSVIPGDIAPGQSPA